MSKKLRKVKKSSIKRKFKIQLVTSYKFKVIGFHGMLDYISFKLVYCGENWNKNEITRKVIYILGVC